MSLYKELDETIQEDFPHIYGVQIYHENSLAFETYHDGVARETLHPTGCIFKSFVSAAVGVAIGDGLIRSVSQPFADFFPTLHFANPAFQAITIQHALTKTTGIIWPPPGADADIHGMEDAAALDVGTAPGEVFAYKPDPQLLVFLLERVTGIPFATYMQERIFGPLGIPPVPWDPSMATIQDLKLPLGEMAKLGQLYLAGGTWNGFSPLPASYVEDSLQAHVDAGFPEQAGYGYLWWIGTIEETPFFFSSGFGGQYLVAIPDRSMLVVIVSKMDRPHPENKLIVRNVLRGVARE